MNRIWRVAIAFTFALGLGRYCLPQASPYSISNFAAQSFTATNQTGAAIPLNGLTSGSSTVGSSFASGNITVTGSGLTTVTFGVQGSSDNGVTYYPLPISNVSTVGATPTLTVTATSNGLYQISLAGLTHVKFVTSGTFTAASVSLKLAGSPNAMAGSRGNGSGPGAGVASFNTRTGAVTLAASDVNGVGAITNDTTGTAGNATKVNGASVPLNASYVGTDGTGKVIPATAPSTVLLKTNGANNGDQTALNIIGGDGICFVNSGANVTASQCAPFAINSFSGGWTVELGATVTNPAFTASYSATPTSGSITNNLGIGSPTTLTTPFTSATVTGAFTSASNGCPVTFTLAAIGASTKTATQQGCFRPRTFYGLGTGTPTGATASGTSAVLTGATGTLPSWGLNQETGTVTLNPSAQSVYFILSGASHTFKVNGFTTAPSTVAITFVNANGISTSMTIYYFPSATGSYIYEVA